LDGAKSSEHRADEVDENQRARHGPAAFGLDAAAKKEEIILPMQPLTRHLELSFRIPHFTFPV
jgi:hypothetical protein